MTDGFAKVSAPWLRRARIVGMGRDAHVLTIAPDGASLTSPEGERVRRLGGALAACVSPGGQLTAWADRRQCTVLDAKIEQTHARFRVRGAIDAPRPVFLDDASGVAFGPRLYRWDGTAKERPEAVPDVRVAASRESTEVVRVSSGEVLARLPFEALYAHVRSDGRYAAIVTREGLRVIAVATRPETVLELDVRFVGTAAFGPEGSFAYARPTEAEVWVHGALVEPVSAHEAADARIVSALAVTGTVEVARHFSLTGRQRARLTRFAEDLNGWIRRDILDAIVSKAAAQEAVFELAMALLEADSTKDMEELGDSLQRWIPHEPPFLAGEEYERSMREFAELDDDVDP